MKTKNDIVENWLPRYTGEKLNEFGEYILLTNFSNYVSMFAEWNKVKIVGLDRPMQCATADNITITVNDLPSKPVVSNSNGNLSSTSVAGASYIWFKDGVTIAGANSFTHKTTVTGSFKISHTQNGCTAISDAVIVSISGVNTTTGIDTEIIENKITLYPNPVKEILMVATEQGIKKSDLKIKIYDMNQKLVLTKTFTEGICKGGKGKECLCPGLSEVDLTTLPEGMYIVNISDRKSVLLTRRLVKQ